MNQCCHENLQHEAPITNEEAKRWLNSIEFTHYTSLMCVEKRSEKDKQALKILVHKVNNRKNHGPLCQHSCCW